MELLSLVFRRIERVLLRPFVSLLVKPLDIGLELSPIDTPDAASADLDGRQASRPHQGIDLRATDIQKFRDVLEGHEARLTRASSGSGHSVTTRVRTHNMESSTGQGQIPGFDVICLCLRVANPLLSQEA